MAGPVHYQVGAFPPATLDWPRLIPLLGPASAAVARYDGILAAIPNASVLLSPLVTQEAVLSSRIEGTQATMGEVLEFEAEVAAPDLSDPGSHGAPPAAGVSGPRSRRGNLPRPRPSGGGTHLPAPVEHRRRSGGVLMCMGAKQNPLWFTDRGSMNHKSLCCAPVSDKQAERDTGHVELWEAWQPAVRMEPPPGDHDA